MKEALSARTTHAGADFPLVALKKDGVYVCIGLILFEICDGQASSHDTPRDRSFTRHHG